MHKKIIVSVTIVLVTLILAACGNGNGSGRDMGSSVEINFDTQGGEALTSREVAIEHLNPDFLPEPNKEDHAFVGWYFDADLTDSFSADALEDGMSITLYAAWEEVLMHTVSFYVQDELYETIAVIDGDSLSLPSAPSQAGYAFVGWYLDEAFEESLDAAQIITEDISFYARFESEDAVFDEDDLGDLSVVYDTFAQVSEEPDDIQGLAYFYLENLQIIYQGQVDDHPLYLLTDGVYNILALTSIEATLGDVVSLDAAIDLSLDFPFIIEVDDLEIVAENAFYEIDEYHGTLETVKATLAYGPQFVVTEGLYRVEHEDLIMVDPNSLDIAQIIDVPNITHLEGYASIGVLLIETRYDLIGIHIPALAHFQTIDLNPSEQIAMIESLIHGLFDREIMTPGRPLAFFFEDDFFGASLTYQVDDDSSAYYDQENDRFLSTQEAVEVLFDFELTLDSQTSTFSSSITLKPHDTDRILDGFTLEEGTLRITVLRSYDNGILVDDGEALIYLENYTGATFEPGENLLVRTYFMHQSELISGVIIEVLERSEGEIPQLNSAQMTLNGLNDLTQAGAQYVTLEGLLIEPSFSHYPFALTTGADIIYIEMAPFGDIYNQLSDLSGSYLSLEIAVIKHHQNDHQAGYVGIIHPDDTLEVKEMDDEMLLEIASQEIKAMDFYFRPGEKVSLPFYLDSYDVDVTYSYDEQTFVDIEDTGRNLSLHFKDSGTFEMQVSLHINDATYQFSVDVVSEAYDLTAISDAKTTSERVYIHADVAGISTTYNVLLSDETGLLMLDPNTVPTVWLQRGESVLLSGVVEEIDGIYWLSEAEIEMMMNIEASHPEAQPTDFKAIESGEAPNFTLVKLSGRLAYGTESGNLGLWQIGSQTLYVELGLGMLDNSLVSYVGMDITLLGVLKEDVNGDITFIYVERVATEQSGPIEDVLTYETDTRVHLHVYHLAFYENHMYLLDETGVFSIKGIHETFALNRIGQASDLEASVLIDDGLAKFTVEEVFFNDRYDADINDFMPTFDVSDDFAELDEATMYYQLWALEGTLQHQDDNYYLEDAYGEQIIIKDLDNQFDLDTYLGDTISLEVFITFHQIDDKLVAVLLPNQTLGE